MKGTMQLKNLFIGPEKILFLNKKRRLFTHATSFVSGNRYAAFN